MAVVVPRPWHVAVLRGDLVERVPLRPLQQCLLGFIHSYNEANLGEVGLGRCFEADVGVRVVVARPHCVAEPSRIAWVDWILQFQVTVSTLFISIRLKLGWN